METYNHPIIQLFEGYCPEVPVIKQLHEWKASKYEAERKVLLAQLNKSLDAADLAAKRRSKALKKEVLDLIDTGLAVGAYHAAVDAAENYGEILKSAVDMFRLKMLQSLGYKCPAEMEDERKLWQTLDQAMFYGRPDLDPLRTQLAKPESSGDKEPG